MTVARHVARTLAATLLLVLPTAAAQEPLPPARPAATGPFLGGFLKETRIVYPLSIGEWGAVGEQRYDAPEAGVSVRYQADGDTSRWIDVYFYPVGVVARSHLDRAARGVLADVEAGVGPGGYLEVEPGPMRAFRVPRRQDDPDPLPARSADMRLLREEGAYNSAMALLIDRLYYVKARHSVEEALMERAAVREALEAFIGELVPRTYIGSTGTCWSPLPVEALPAGDPAPADARLAIEGDGDGEDQRGGELVGQAVECTERIARGFFEALADHRVVEHQVLVGGLVHGDRRDRQRPGVSLPALALRAVVVFLGPFGMQLAPARDTSSHRLPCLKLGTNPRVQRVTADRCSVSSAWSRQEPAR